MTSDEIRVLVNKIFDQVTDANHYQDGHQSAFDYIVRTLETIYASGQASK